MTTAIVAPFAHPYAHPVDNRPSRAQPYGPHDPAGNPPALIETKCAGRYPVCNREAHPRAGSHIVLVETPPALQRQRQQINNLAREAVLHANMEDHMPAATQAAHAGTWQDPKPMLSGFCNPTNDAMSHARCRTHYVTPGPEGSSTILRCRCSRDGCACNSDVAVAQEVHPCGHVARTTGCGGCDPAAVEYVIRDDAPGVVQKYDAARDMQQAGTSWSAEEVVDLMVELEACPLCDAAWDAHTFTDDDRVVC